MTPTIFARLRVTLPAFVLGIACIPLLPAAENEEEPKEKDEQSSTSWKLKRQSSSTQSQNASGGPLGNAVSPAASLFGAGELQILGYGTGGFGDATHNITEEKTVKQTTTVYETHLETKTTFRRTFVPSRVGPGTFVVTPVQTRVPVTTKRQVTRNVQIKTTKNVAGTDGGFGGAGAEARYFLTNWLGVGVEGDWLEGNESSGMTLATFTARFIRDSNAFYGFGGVGAQFNSYYTQTIGKLGLGVEHRVAAGTGVFADGAWMFGSQQNAAVFRAGVRFSF